MAFDAYILTVEKVKQFQAIQPNMRALISFLFDKEITNKIKIVPLSFYDSMKLFSVSLEYWIPRVSMACALIIFLLESRFMKYKMVVFVSLSLYASKAFQGITNIKAQGGSDRELVSCLPLMFFLSSYSKNLGQNNFNMTTQSLHICLCCVFSSNPKPRPMPIHEGFLPRSCFE